MKQYQSALAKPELSPMMRQYCLTHQEYDDYLLLYRLGDFYELFFDDAEIVARELELVLTGRDAGLSERVPMCGMPHHAVDNYINRLLAKGYKLAVCDQVEDPALAKGLVKREITRLITTGTQTDVSAIDKASNNWLVACYQQKNYYGLAVLELVSGQFLACQINLGLTDKTLFNELVNYQAGEYLLPCSMQNQPLAKSLEQINLNINYLPETNYQSLDKTYLPFDFKLEDLLPDKLESTQALAYGAILALLNYVLKTQHSLPSHLQKLQFYRISDYLQIDAASQANLELFTTLREKKKKGSLLWAIDQTKSAMGLRLLKQWLEKPLLDVKEIKSRQNIVQTLLANYRERQNLRDLIGQVYDIERLAGKLGNGTVLPRDLLAIKDSLELIPAFKQILASLADPNLTNLAENLQPLPEIVDLINQSIAPDCTNIIKDGGIIKPKFSAELDHLRSVKTDSQTWFDAYVQAEKDKTGIKNMKIGYSRIHGYFLEVSKLNLNLVPDYYIRRQTLVNNERFTTKELKARENEILGAEAKLYSVELELFNQVRDQVKTEIKAYQLNAQILSQLDVLQSFAEQAEQADYCCPEFVETKCLNLKAARHAVLEKLAGRANFVANDCELDADNHFILLTGPNMAGKSTYMRQIALICLLAQIGSFVPATSCQLSPVDQIFTRIGASDDLGLGKSTFMVEMQEMAYILHNMTHNSLLILDEIGRGTGTADGLSIAWAICEALNSDAALKARTLFATHYHELIKLAKQFNSIRNYHVTVAETNDSITFLHKIKAGGTDQSYGVEVAKLAGLPKSITERANSIMEELGKQIYQNKLTISKCEQPMANQVQLFSPEQAKKDELLANLQKIDINQLSPLDALHKLNDLVQATRKLNSLN